MDNIVIETQICKKCAKTKSIYNFSFRNDTNKRRRICNACTIKSKTNRMDIEIERRNLFIEGKKKCNKCLEIKNSKDFYGKEPNRNYICNSCAKIRRSKTKDLAVDKRFKKVYGISLIKYNEMLDSQNNSCAICLKNKDKFKKRLVVDHDHVSGKVRGLLCFRCNVSIGSFDDNVETIQRSIEYLNKFKTIISPSVEFNS